MRTVFRYFWNDGIIHDNTLQQNLLLDFIVEGER